jgi:VIT1/CCC1 family predicted Fe2+/Mn2+ transporter
MAAKDISQASKEKLLKMQKDEITEYKIYHKLADRAKNKKNASIMREIADDEKRHHDIWQKYTKTEVKAHTWKVYFYYFISLIFGITFGIKLMEQGEESAQEEYLGLVPEVKEAEQVMNEEEDHENQLINLLHEERLDYAGSVVLGLNDALVELTGTLAGLSFAMQNTEIIALSGSITGIAAAFSMAASEYLSAKTDEEEDALKSAFYTGTAYIVTVIVLVAPFLLLDYYMYALGFTIAAAILVIFIFNFYISVAKDLDFKKRFWEMAIISISVAGFSFFVGYLIRIIFGIEI